MEPQIWDVVKIKLVLLLISEARKAPGDCDTAAATVSPFLLSTFLLLSCKPTTSGHSCCCPKGSFIFKLSRALAQRAFVTHGSQTSHHGKKQRAGIPAVTAKPSSETAENEVEVALPPAATGYSRQLRGALTLEEHSEEKTQTQAESGPSQITTAM